MLRGTYCCSVHWYAPDLDRVENTAVVGIVSLNSHYSQSAERLIHAMLRSQYIDSESQGWKGPTRSLVQPPSHYYHKLLNHIL